LPQPARGSTLGLQPTSAAAAPRAAAARHGMASDADAVVVGAPEPINLDRFCDLLEVRQMNTGNHQLAAAHASVHCAKKRGRLFMDASLFGYRVRSRASPEQATGTLCASCARGRAGSARAGSVRARARGPRDTRALRGKHSGAQMRPTRPHRSPLASLHVLCESMPYLAAYIRSG